jgi:cytochrome c
MTKAAPGKRLPRLTQIKVMTPVCRRECKKARTNMPKNLMRTFSMLKARLVRSLLRERCKLVVPLAASAWLSASSLAAANGNIQAGQDLAQRWCSSCHIVDQSGHGADTAPPFPIIAKQNPKDHDWLRAWITAPHPPMPNLNLSRQQIDDVVAYIGSLAPH